MIWKTHRFSRGVYALQYNLQTILFQRGDQTNSLCWLLFGVIFVHFHGYIFLFWHFCFMITNMENLRNTFRVKIFLRQKQTLLLVHTRTICDRILLHGTFYEIWKWCWLWMAIPMARKRDISLPEDYDQQQQQQQIQQWSETNGQTNKRTN